MSTKLWLLYALLFSYILQDFAVVIFVYYYKSFYRLSVLASSFIATGSFKR